MTEPGYPTTDDPAAVPQPENGQEWLRLHPATIADDVLQRLPRVLIGLFLILSGVGRDAVVDLVMLALGSLAIAPVVVRYLTGRYRVGPDLLQWRVGILKKVETDLPRHRIQSVDTRINIIGRIFSLETVVVSSAGGEGEITIGLVTSPDADSLRAELSPDTVQEALIEPQEGEWTEEWGAPIVPGRELATLTASDLPRVMLVNTGRLIWFLVLIAISIGVVVAISVGFLQPRDLIFFLAIPPLAFALATGIATQAIGFSSRLHGDRIRVARGIITRTKFDAPLARVQGVTIERSIPARRIGTEAISVDTADVSGEASLNQTLVHPITPAGTWKEWVPLFLGTPVPDPDEFHRVAPVSLRRRWIAEARDAVALGVVGALVAWPLTAWIGREQLVIGIAVAVAVLLPLMSGLVETLSYRNERWALGDETVAFRRGAFTTSLVVVPRARVQGVMIQANWFQRRVGVANIAVDTASPTVLGKGRDLYLTDAVMLSGELLGSIDAGGGV